MEKNAELLRRALFSVAALAQHRRFLRLSRDTRSVSLRWRGSRRASSAPRPAAFVAPCSLGASLAAPVPPKRSVRTAASFCRVQPRPFSFAPLLGRPPGGSLVGALKRIVFRALIVATPSRKASAGACLFGTRRRKRHSRPRSFVPLSARPVGWVGLPGATGRSRSHRSRSSWAQCLSFCCNSRVIWPQALFPLGRQRASVPPSPPTTTPKYGEIAGLPPAL